VRRFSCETFSRSLRCNIEVDLKNYRRKKRGLRRIIKINSNPFRKKTTPSHLESLNLNPEVVFFEGFPCVVLKITTIKNCHIDLQFEICEASLITDYLAFVWFYNLQKINAEGSLKGVFVSNPDVK
jgi:hypothetical protein